MQLTELMLGFIQWPRAHRTTPAHTQMRAVQVTPTMGSMATKEVGSWVEAPHPTPQVAWVAEEHNLAHSRALGEQKQVAALVVLDTRRHGKAPLPFSQGPRYSTSPSHPGLAHTCPVHLRLTLVLSLALPYCDPQAWRGCRRQP